MTNCTGSWVRLDFKSSLEALKAPWFYLRAQFAALHGRVILYFLKLGESWYWNCSKQHQFQPIQLSSPDRVFASLKTNVAQRSYINASHAETFYYPVSTKYRLQIADCGPGTKCRLQTRYKMQTNQEPSNRLLDELNT